MKSKKQSIIYLILGICILGAGAFLAKNYRDAKDIMGSLPYILIGIGSGIFGKNLGNLLTLSSYKNHPQEAKLAEIEENDERNIAIRNKAKASAFDLMVYTFGALMLAYALLNAELYVTLSLVGAYLFVVFSNVYFLNKYNKEM